MAIGHGWFIGTYSTSKPIDRFSNIGNPNRVPRRCLLFTFMKQAAAEARNDQRNCSLTHRAALRGDAKRARASTRPVLSPAQWPIRWQHSYWVWVGFRSIGKGWCFSENQIRVCLKESGWPLGWRGQWCYIAFALVHHLMQWRASRRTGPVSGHRISFRRWFSTIGRGLNPSRGLLKLVRGTQYHLFFHPRGTLPHPVVPGPAPPGGRDVIVVSSKSGSDNISK